MCERRSGCSTSMYELKARVLQNMASPLKFQTRTITCFPGGDGFCVGSVEGRVAMQ